MSPTPLRTRRSGLPARRLLLAGPLLLSGALLWGCAGDRPALVAEGAALPPSQLAFLQALATHCGQGYPGALILEPEGDPMLTGEELLVAHFRDCEPHELRLPFHIELEDGGGWDRSRTWYLMEAEGGLELRHDHREPDGSESRRTWYGGFTQGAGSPGRQDFHSPERSAAAGVPVGWRIEVDPGVHYRYGTTYDGEFDWMIEFDLSAPLPGSIPDAWGHPTPPSRIPGPP